MTAALDGMLVIALLALVSGELGRRRNRQTGVTTRWAILGSAIGVTMSALFVALAPAPGVDAYVMRTFLIWWLIDTVWWSRATASFLMRSSLIEWGWRLTASAMVIRAALVFSGPAGSAVAATTAAALLFVWWHAPSNRHARVS